MNDEASLLSDQGTMITFEVGCPRPGSAADAAALDAFIDALENDGVAQVRIEFR